jgi:hypothetical protein
MRQTRLQVLASLHNLLRANGEHRMSSQQDYPVSGICVHTLTVTGTPK